MNNKNIKSSLLLVADDRLANNTTMSTMLAETTSPAANEQTLATSLIKSATRSGVNFFLTSSSQCVMYGNKRPYCIYTTLLVLVSYILFAILFGVTLFRMNKLTERFRNQYNLSLIWLYSIFLIFSIDLLEFIVDNDPYVHSRLSIGTVCITLCFLIMLCLRYFDLNHLKDRHFFRAMFGLVATLVMLVLILISRVWAINRRQSLSAASLPTSSPPSDTTTVTANATMISTISTTRTKSTKSTTDLYMIFYNSVLLVFGSVQIYENAKANIARVFSNMAYVLWLSACALQAFYLSTLPSTKEYDYIFYRVFLMFSTMLWIITQELFITRSRAAQKLFELVYSINSIMVTNTRGSSLNNGVAKVSNNFQFIENAFQNNKNMSPAAVSGGGGGGNGGIMNDEEEEEVYSRTTLTSTYTGGQAALHSMTVVDEAETARVNVTIKTAGEGDEMQIDESRTPKAYRKQIRSCTLAIVFTSMFIFVSIFLLLSRVKLTLTTQLIILVNPLTIVVAFILNRYKLI